MANRNKATRQNANRKIVEAIQKHLSGNVTFSGVKYTPSQLAKMFQGGIDIADATDAARKQWAVAVAAEKSNQTSLTGVQSSLRNYVAATYGETSTEFADFGFTPRKVRTVDVDKKAAARAKRLATRKARNTMGSRQKLKVTGATASAASAPAETPVASQPVTPAPATAPVNGIATAAKPS
jgi:hypothetical protein